MPSAHLPEMWTLQNEGEGSWSAFEVLRSPDPCRTYRLDDPYKIILQFGERHPLSHCIVGDKHANKVSVTGGQLLDEFGSSAIGKSE